MKPIEVLAALAEHMIKQRPLSFGYCGGWYEYEGGGSYYATKEKAILALVSDLQRHFEERIEIQPKELSK